jgi:hypothetical protein
MQEELASISEVVWLSAPDALDRADSLLSGLGYYTTHRSDYYLTSQRPAPPSSAGQDTYMLTVSASPQAGGGVKVAVRGAPGIFNPRSSDYCLPYCHVAVFIHL